MNFLDTYEITGTGTSTPSDAQPQQSLNEEVSQVMGQLGRFWGGFRKQSESAFAAARKDLTAAVTQAQKELSKLTVESPPPPSEEAERPAEAHTNAEAGSSSQAADAERDLSASIDSSASSSAPSLFSQLQASLPPNIVSTVQNHLPESLKNASQNVDFAQLRSTLSSEFQRMQGVTRVQAEEYVHKSESLLREAMREASEVLRDAVKVIPPEEAPSSTVISAWDGSDVWMFPTTQSEGSSSKGKGRETDSEHSSRRQSMEAQHAVATRAEMLMKQLKYDPNVIMFDPQDQASIKEKFLKWSEEVYVKEGSADGSVWAETISSTLADPVDGQAFKATYDVLVPSTLTREVFWQRYFFRVHQIEEEGERRKAVLKGAIESEEDFSWEDDDDDALSHTAKLNDSGESTQKSATESSRVGKSPSQDTLAVPSRVRNALRSASSSQARTPATSPPESSEESFDVVSSGISAAGDTGKKDDDAYSDWE